MQLIEVQQNHGPGKLASTEHVKDNAHQQQIILHPAEAPSVSQQQLLLPSAGCLTSLAATLGD
jgi:hypothetical protein